MNRKLLIIIIIIAATAAYFGYQYYFKTQKSIILPEQKIEKTELSQEEIQKIIERNSLDPNARELSEKEKQKIFQHQHKN